MFGWGSDARRKKAAKALEQQLRGGGDARALIEQVKPGDRSAAVHLAITALLFDDHNDLAAALARAANQLDVRGHDAGHSIASALIMVRDYAAAMAMCERMLDDDPYDESWVLRLGELLIADGSPQAALDLLAEGGFDTSATALCRAQALAALDRPAEALELADRVCEVTLLQMKKAITNDEWQHAKIANQHASELRGSLQAELHGAETIGVSDAFRGHLDGRAGVNYRLLAESLMTAERRAPAQCYLQTPDDTLQYCTLLTDGTASKLALRGSAELRLGRIDDARRSFEAACEADKRHFAGLRGLAAVYDHERHALWKRVEDLPELELSVDAQRVVVDYAALTIRSGAWSRLRSHRSRRSSRRSSPRAR